MSKYPPSRLVGLTGKRLKGKTYEEIFGVVKATAMKEKMRLAKLGQKMPWNSKLGLKGAETPRWIKDRTQVKGRHNRNFHDPLYKQWRKAVYSRDNFKCRIADGYCEGRLEAHHILAWRDYPELRYTINNGITLCHAHHPRRRAEEKRLEPVLQALVSVSN